MSATEISARIHQSSTPSLPERLRAFAQRRPALAVALITLLVGWAALIAAHKAPPAPVLSTATAMHDLRTDPVSEAIVARTHFTSAAPAALSSRFMSVTLYDHGRIVLTAVLAKSGKVQFALPQAKASAVGVGDLSSRPLVIALMSIVFVLMTAVMPLRRIRNLDVLIVVATASAIFLFNAFMTARMVLVAYPLMVHLAIRCAVIALGGQAAAKPETPLFEALTERLSGAQRIRILRFVLLAAVLIVAMVGISSRALIDVAYAVMEGATGIVHGVLPYNHIADVAHGDTYPIGSYLAYVPFALLSPVHSEWDSADITLVVTVLASLLGALGIYRLAAPRVATRKRDEAQKLLGLRAAIAWLTFPPLLVAVSTGTSDVLLAAVLIGALLLFRKPAISATVLSAGAWFKLAPAALIPLWLAPLGREQRTRAVAGVALVSLAMVAAIVALGGPGGAGDMVHAIGFQASRPPLNSLWSVTGSVPLQQLTEAATLALIAGAVVMLRRDPQLAGDRRRVAALGGAVMLGLQMSSSYWTFMYLVWALPFLLLVMFSAEPSGAAV
jgi:hypothetical protein